jgi:hypothetical protein
MSKSPILAPSRANLRQIAAPMPLAAPVTTTTLFLKLSQPNENIPKKLSFFPRPRSEKVAPAGP